jgi:hypothetical protein
MKRRRPSCTALLAVGFAVIASCPLTAQTDLETNSAVQFNFAAPGAANLALGGAFVGLAFDGTAAYTNPAGLTQVLDPEGWVEARSWRFTHVFTARGRIEGQERTGDGADDVAGLRTGTASDGVAGPSFACYVHPGERWSFAVYFHKLLDFEADFSTQGAYLERVRGRNPEGLGILGERSGRLPALRNTMEADIDSFGLAVARRLTRTVSAGVAVSYSRFRIDSLAERFVPPLAEKPHFDDPKQHVSDQVQEGSDDDWSWNLGLLWQTPSRRWSLGAVHRQGPDFEFDTRSVSRRPAASPLHFDTVSARAVFHVPDVYGVGFAWRPTDRFTLAVDYDRVEYSDLLDDLVDIFHLQDLAAANPELGAFRIDDADELHVGAEIWMPRQDRAVSLRLGAWYDPDHTLRFEGENVAYRAVYRGGSDEIHLTAGAGLALRTIQIDVAVDYSERVSIASLSAGMRF